jgi:hypothetical protein
MLWQKNWKKYLPNARLASKHFVVGKNPPYEMYPVKKPNDFFWKKSITLMSCRHDSQVFKASGHVMKHFSFFLLWFCLNFNNWSKKMFAKKQKRNFNHLKFWNLGCRQKTNVFGVKFPLKMFG